MPLSRANIVLNNLVRAKIRTLTESEYKFVSRFKTVPTRTGLALVYETSIFGNIKIVHASKIDTHTFNKLHMIANTGRKH